jgi:hypothetical protein
VSKSQHLSCCLSAILALLPAFAAAQTPTLAPAQIVGLVKLTPQLKIDVSVNSSAFDSATHPYVNVLDVAEGQTAGGFLVSDRAHQGTLSDGQDVLIVPLDSGGSGGIFTQVVFARRGDRAFTYAGHIGSERGHLDVRFQLGAIVADLPHYGPSDPNCCPSQRIFDTYTVRDGRLVKLLEKRLTIPKGE